MQRKAEDIDRLQAQPRSAYHMQHFALSKAGTEDGMNSLHHFVQYAWQMYTDLACLLVHHFTHTFWQSGRMFLLHDVTVAHMLYCIRMWRSASASFVLVCSIVQEHIVILLSGHRTAVLNRSVDTVGQCSAAQVCRISAPCQRSARWFCTSAEAQGQVFHQRGVCCW